MVKVQVDLEPKEDAIVSYYRSLKGLQTKAEALKYIVNLTGRDLE